MHTPNFIDLTGYKFGRLTVLKIGEPRFQPNGTRRTMWVCKCECGTVKEFEGKSLRSGKTTSCGCYRDEHNRALQLKTNIYDLTGEYGICYFNNGGKFIFDLDEQIIADVMKSGFANSNWELAKIRVDDLKDRQYHVRNLEELFK